MNRKLFLQTALTITRELKNVKLDFFYKDLSELDNPKKLAEWSSSISSVKEELFSYEDLEKCLKYLQYLIEVKDKLCNKKTQYISIYNFQPVGDDENCYEISAYILNLNPQKLINKREAEICQLIIDPKTGEIMSNLEHLSRKDDKDYYKIYLEAYPEEVAETYGPYKVNSNKAPSDIKAAIFSKDNIRLTFHKNIGDKKFSTEYKIVQRFNSCPNITQLQTAAEENSPPKKRFSYDS